MQVIRTITSCAYPPDYEIHLPEGQRFHVLLVIRSSARLVTADGDNMMHPGQVYLFQKGYPRFLYAVGKPFRLDWLHFTLEEGEEERLKKLGLPLNKGFDVASPSSISEILSRISFDMQLEGALRGELLRAELWYLFIKTAHMKSMFDEGSKISAYSKKLWALRARLFEKPWERLSPARAAADMNISLSRFEQLYKKTFGCSFIEESINCRIGYAKDVLSESCRPIEQVAQICGYNEPSHFIRQFKARVGITPGQYRKDKLPR